MKTVIYARVSTDEQTVDNQLDALRGWVKSRGWELTAIYQENESAWKDGHQKELARLLVDAHRGKFQQVTVWALDRLTRGGSLAILTLVHRLQKSGVRVISYQESWTEAPGELGELLYAVMGWIARMESQRRSERTKAGLAWLKTQGKRLGRPPGSKDRNKRPPRRKLKIAGVKS